MMSWEESAGSEMGSAIAGSGDLSRAGLRPGRPEDAPALQQLLVESFNPATLDNLMCLRQVSLSWDGLIYDCDFNQMLDMRLSNGRVFRLGKAPAAQIAASLIGKPIRTGAHCYGCTAGFGSSCAGALA